MRIDSSFFFAFLMILMLSPATESYATANLSTSWTNDGLRNSIIDRPMLHREANVAQFSLGFFCEEVYICTSYIIAIIISHTTKDPPKGEVIWTANRNFPVGINAILNLTATGDLVLKDGDGSIVWTTNTAGKSVVGMNLTDTGNLVLFDCYNSVVWQSFDHPTDSLVPGQKLFSDQILKSSVSLTNFSEGMFSLQVTSEGVVGYVESNPPQVYFTVLAYKKDTHKGKRYIRFLNGSLSLFIHSSEPSIYDAAIFIPRSSSAQYMKLMPNGHLQAFEWQSLPDRWGWTMVTDLSDVIVDGSCGYPLACGRNSICSANKQCSCPTKYFRPVDVHAAEQGCSEITSLTCNSSQNQHFVTLEDVTYFTWTTDMEGVNTETCKQACLNNCSCKVAFFRYLSNVSNGECFLLSEIFTMNSNGSYYNTLAFIKIQNVTTPPLSPQVPPVAGSTNHSSPQVATVVSSTIGSFVLVLVVAIVIIVCLVNKRKRDAEMEDEYIDQVPGMPNRFSYEELKTATENFSKKLGEGGYWSVFEGTLRDGTKIAVKCLEGLAHVKKSFLAEVQSIGSIHHVNLVRLCGFCAWKSQQFLVYEFMSNGSLDRWIYHGVREHILEWECRKSIILDIAKGLAYLHEECRQKIVHLDIKPQNILLDINFNAKVSDFGLSKLIDKTQTEVMSTIKGTPGYIAPEWRSSIITEKLDVYSFGIVLLEVLCGRKIFDRSQREECWHLLFVFQKCWEQGTLLDVVDKHSEDMQVHKTEVAEMMKVAAWCLQTNFKRRPSMSMVVKVLEGVMHVESNLDYNFTDLRIQEPAVGDERDFTLLASSLLSGPR